MLLQLPAASGGMPLCPQKSMGVLALGPEQSAVTLALVDPKLNIGVAGLGSVDPADS